jgi:hypothetical protein
MQISSPKRWVYYSMKRKNLHLAGIRDINGYKSSSNPPATFQDLQPTIKLTCMPCESQAYFSETLNWPVSRGQSFPRPTAYYKNWVPPHATWVSNLLLLNPNLVYEQGVKQSIDMDKGCKWNLVFLQNYPRGS